MKKKKKQKRSKKEKRTNRKRNLLEVPKPQKPIGNLLGVSQNRNWQAMRTWFMGRPNLSCPCANARHFDADSVKQGFPFELLNARHFDADSVKQATRSITCLLQQREALTIKPQSAASGVMEIFFNGKQILKTSKPKQFLEYDIFLSANTF